MRMTSKIGRIAASLAEALLPVSWVKSESAIPIVGIYSDLQYFAGDGGLLGAELKIVKDGTSYKGFLQIAEGAPSKVIPVNIKVRRNEIRFTIADDTNYAGEYEGEVDAQFLVGMFRFKRGSRHLIALQRGTSYWDRSHS
jgi:hypothetical protein